jgi:hypothetical protein
VKDPQEALDIARQRAHDRPASERDDAAWSLERSSVSAPQLAQWAIIDPDRVQLYSTRRFGRPLSALRRLLARMQRQYMSDVAAQQSRFNAQITAYAERLEKRVEALEASGDGPDAPASR